MEKIDKLIINSPYEEPKYHWHYNRETRSFEKLTGRRPAGYVVASEKSKSFDDPGIFIELPLPNKIRTRIKKWRNAGYPGVTGITKKLLEYWYNPEERENKNFFFCQLEAIETMIWLTEASESEKTGVDIPSDGGDFKRICSKMATGSGKTVVMAMLVTWQVLNKITYPQDPRFSKYIFVVAPGLTVKNRLQVLMPATLGNYYEEFNIVPSGLWEKLREGRIRVINWHKLHWETEVQIQRKRHVDKRGPISDEAYVREVLRELARGSNILVINDEAHHAWRINPAAKDKYLRQRDLKDSAEEATIWVGGLDRIHHTRKILCCYDFTATPFMPSGKQSSEETLYGWVVSDFGLNDAIESGLVKTPRVIIRDDAQLGPDYKSRLYHIYADPEVKDDLNRKADDEEPLPDLVMNAYYLLGKDWLETVKKWKKAGFQTPPVMISVANRTETAARIKNAFDKKKIKIEELCVPERILHIDSKVLKGAEEKDESIVIASTDEEENDKSERRYTKEEMAERLREYVDTVGQVGRRGELIQKVISVGMLSEGWDAKTVTHIMGLRAFTSQLLCEQVVGRGLRRTSYEVDKESGLFEAEYVNIFGIPFTFLPHEAKDGPPPPPPSPKSRIEPDPKKQQHEITWPNIIRIDHVYKPTLQIDMTKVKTLELNAYETATLADLAPVIDGKPDITKITTIDLEELGRKFRMQKIIFESARDIYDQMKPVWKADKNYLLIQIIHIVEQFLNSDKVYFTQQIFKQDELKRRILLTLNMNKIVQHIWEAIRFENTEHIEPVFDRDRPIKSTGDMRTWFTGRPCEYTVKSHINMCVFDSTWEASESWEFDRNKDVLAWVKNDHLGFEILYIYNGIISKYRPDFILKLSNGKYFVLETKGQDSHQDVTKRQFLDEWIKAVNQHEGFGQWAWAVSKHPTDIKQIIRDAIAK
ncbi:MAG: DEAD/DEAH box helicase family protein [bacterium]